MRSRQLGSTGLQTTELGFGAAPLGNLYREISDEQAVAAVDAAWAAGVRYFDTAPHYGLGTSERRLGAALATRRREEYVLSTKVGRLLVPNPRPRGSDMDAGFAVPDKWTRVRDYTADGTRRSIDASLARLGTDRIDIALIHDAEDFMDDALRRAIPALIELRDQGVIRAVGAGMNFAQPLRRFVDETDIDVVMVAGRWTLLDRSGCGLLDRCAEKGVSVLSAAPFNSGLLARAWPDESVRFNYAPVPAGLLATARALAGVCEAHGTTLPHAALRFPLRHPSVVSVVTGLGSAAHAESAAAGILSDLDAETWRDLDAVATGAQMS